MRILYISDSLGTPIHPRGIFNFSISLVEILKSFGATVDLVVEGADSFGLNGYVDNEFNAAPDIGEIDPNSVNSVRLSEIHRYFNISHFSYRWGYRSARIRRLASMARPAVSAWLTLRERMNYRPNIPVRNDISQIDFVPAKSEHLNLFDNLVIKQNFYSSSMSRANMGLPAPTIDVSGYDLTIVDTPHFIRIEGAKAERIVTVVHDLIPLRDPFMNSNWRNIFLHKLVATLAMRGNMLFVSKYTQRIFHASFPRHAAPREFIVHPAIRQKLISDADLPAEHEDAAKVLEEVAPFLADMQKRDVGDRKPKSKSKAKRGSHHGGNPMPPGYDPSLPFFVTATSDEPRKNIAVIVRAFYQLLRGRVNVVILGEVNSHRYDPGPDANVYFPGYVSDAEKIAYFQHARGVVFASLSEGFGIPLVEGAVMGLPVVCSDIEVFHEVAGDDAYYFDPHDPASLGRAIEDALAHPEEAARRAAALKTAALARFSQEAVGAQVRAALGQIGLKVG